MPRGDRTGPDGMGPMTGRAAGFCSGNDRPGFMNNGRRSFFGSGRRMGRGSNFGFAGVGRHFGRGYDPNWNYYSPNSPVRQDAKSEKAFLENEIKELNVQLAALQDRLSDLSKEE